MISHSRRTGLKEGFTLVEIMVVVAVIATLIAIAVPSMLRARVNANEVTAIAGSRAIATGSQNYYNNVTPHTYPSALSSLTTPASDPAYIDPVLASGTRQGYEYTYNLVDAEHFTLSANPTSPGRTGVRYFFVDETGVVRANASGPASATDPPVE